MEMFRSIFMVKIIIIIIIKIIIMVVIIMHVIHYQQEKRWKKAEPRVIGSHATVQIAHPDVTAFQSQNTVWRTYALDIVASQTLSLSLRIRFL